MTAESSYAIADEGFVGPYALNRVHEGDSVQLVDTLPDDSLDVLVTSPPYWGQRLGAGMGNEADPREYVAHLAKIFAAVRPKMKKGSTVWINLGDAYNTPVNWRLEDRSYSTLGADGHGLADANSAYVKPRAKRRAFIEPTHPWLQYGNLLALPYRLIIALCDAGFLFRGEVIWHKKNPMPEGRCRRPHRQHEPIYLLARDEKHAFRATPPVGSVWEFSNEKIAGPAHYSRFPTELPRRCIEAHGERGPEVIVFDPFSGSGTTGVAAMEHGCSYLGFEIDPQQVAASNARLESLSAMPRLFSR